MRYIFLSHKIDNDTPLYGCKKLVTITQNKSINKGDTSNNLLLQFPNHCSTHIDFPSHFCKKGKSLNDYGANFWIFNNIGFIKSTIDKLEKNISKLEKNIEILIVKTGFEKFRDKDKYWKNQPVIKPELANVLKNKFSKLRVFGFDMISLSSWQNRQMGRLAHKEFLCKMQILILEDMKLSGLHITPKQIIISPLLINKADGSPCNVLAHV